MKTFREYIKKKFRIILVIRKFLLEFIHINWTKTLYLNFKFFKFKIAIKLPVIVYGKLKFRTAKGAKIILTVPAKRGLLKIGEKFEIFWFNLYGSSQFILKGSFYVNGEIWIGKAIAIYVAKGAELKMGNLTLGSLSTISCSNSIIIGNSCQIGAKTSITDSNNHFFKDLSSGQIHRIEKEVIIGNFNFIGAYSLIMPGTITPDRITIAKGSLSNKDYTKIVQENSIIGGVPAKLIKTDIVRIFDWNKEAKINKYFRETDSDVYIDTDDII
ncbi:MAG: hypothetical protein M0R21_07430 [Lentimicrobiaceae bacterium]|nr:hypothetical protein [Lentimicrobiaceae bacterium]